jgi:hypothetical protein
MAPVIAIVEVHYSVRAAVAVAAVGGLAVAEQSHESSSQVVFFLW